MKFKFEWNITKIGLNPETVKILNKAQLVSMKAYGETTDAELRRLKIPKRDLKLLSSYYHNSYIKVSKFAKECGVTD